MPQKSIPRLWFPRLRIWGGGGGGGGGGGAGGGGGRVGGMMTTLVHRHPEQYLHKSGFTRHLQYFRDGGPSYMMMLDDGDDDDDT